MMLDEGSTKEANGRSQWFLSLQSQRSVRAGETLARRVWQHW